jgi:hypothetical protein
MYKLIQPAKAGCIFVKLKSLNMKAKTFCYLAIFIFVLSNLSYSQSTDSGFPKTKSKSCYEIMKEQSGDEQKSNFVLSLSGGFAGIFEKTTRPNGFNIQADILYPVSKYLALNLGINLTQFPEFHYSYVSQINDSIYNNIDGNEGNLTIINFTPGLTFGIIEAESKLNYYLTAGFTFGISTISSGNSKSHFTNNAYQERIFSYGTESIYIYGGYISGRLSYKISNHFRIYTEPSIFSSWKLSGESNYHINGGISLNL